MPPPVPDEEKPIIDPLTCDYTVEEKIRRLKLKLNTKREVIIEQQVEETVPDDEDFNLRPSPAGSPLLERLPSQREESDFE